MREISPEEVLAWKARERKRFEDGTYSYLPLDWLTSAWFAPPDDANDSYDATIGHYLYPPKYPDHFAHVSIDKVAMVAFTENDAKGVADRQTRMTPGRYLTRFFGPDSPHPVLTRDEIRVMATIMGAQYNDDAELKFAVTADEFEEVYLEGPSSCMSHGPDHYESRVHPVRVYAGHDLQLAYLKREGRITARSLVWPDRKIYSRVYGDITRMERKLHDANYKSGSLAGAKITRKMQKQAYVIPYLDNLVGAYDMGDHLELAGEERRHPTTNEKRCCGGDCQNGLGGSTGYECVDCGDDVDTEDAYHYDGDPYCESCHDGRFGTCDRYGDAYPYDELREVRTRLRDGYWSVQLWCELARDAHAFYCNKDDVYYDSDRNEAYDVEGETWGPAAFEEHGATCEATGKHFHKDNTITLADGTVWSQDYFDEHGHYEGVAAVANDGSTAPRPPERTFAEVQANQTVLPLSPPLPITRVVLSRGYYIERSNITELWVIRDDSEGYSLGGYVIREAAVVAACRLFHLHIVLDQGFSIKHEPNRGDFCWVLYNPDGRREDAWGTFEHAYDDAPRRIARRFIDHSSPPCSATAA